MKYITSLSLLAFAVSAILFGCGGPRGDYSLVDLVKGRGTITLDGAPLPDAVVIFEDPTDDTMSYAKTDENGNYTLQFDSEMSGVKVGKKVVRISTTRKLLALAGKPGEEEDSDGDPAEVKKKPVELVPDKYNKNSELTVDVVQGTTQYDFDLLTK